jgi:hypothetical protein
MIVFSVIAFGRSSRGTRLGVRAWRAGRSNAPAAELALPLELVCARASAIARNKFIDQMRRRVIELSQGRVVRDQRGGQYH